MFVCLHVICPDSVILGRYPALESVLLSRQINIPNWAPRLFLTLGPLLFVVGGCWAANQFSFGSGSESTIGRIVEIRGIGSYRPVAEYFANDIRYEYESSLSSSNSRYSIGDQVEILYDPDEPETASINSFVQRWLFPLALLVAGIMNTSIGFGLRWLLKITPQNGG